MIIYTKLNTEQAVSHVVHKTELVVNVRKMVSEALGVKEHPVERIRLFFRGRELLDEENIFQYDVKDKDTITVTLRASFIPTVQEPTPEAVSAAEAVNTSHTNGIASHTEATQVLPEEPLVEEFLCLTCMNDENKGCRECGCKICSEKSDPDKLLMCDECQYFQHTYCIGLDGVPEGDEDWFCNECKNDPNAVRVAGSGAEHSKKSKMKSATQTKKWGGGMACAGVEKKCTIVKPNHVGKIPGIPVGSSWRWRTQVSAAGIHRPPVGGIAGSANAPAYSIVLAAGYPEDDDKGEEFVYTGSGGRELKEGNRRTAKQTSDQELTRQNMALARACAAPVDAVNGAEAKDWRKGSPIRVVRSYKLAKYHPEYAPAEGNRYDGLYKIWKYQPEKGTSGHIVWRYYFKRDDDEPAPWTEEGKRRIAELGLVMEDDPATAPVTSKKRAATDETGSSTPKRPKSSVNGASQPIQEVPTTPSKLHRYIPSEASLQLIRADVRNVRIWKSILEQELYSEKAFLELVVDSFTCVICSELAQVPVTTPCGHTFCKQCLLRGVKSTGPNCFICKSSLLRDIEVDSDDEADPKQPKLDVSKNSELIAALKSMLPTYGLES